MRALGALVFEDRFERLEPFLAFVGVYIGDD